MFKIITLAFDPNDAVDSHNVDLMKQAFNSAEEAKNFILKEEIPKLLSDCSDEFDSCSYDELSESEQEVSILLSLINEVKLILEYKIVEV